MIDAIQGIGMLTLALNNMIYRLCLSVRETCAVCNACVKDGGIKILADIVNKFTYIPGMLIKDEIITANAGSLYWLRKKVCPLQFCHRAEMNTQERRGNYENASNWIGK